MENLAQELTELYTKLQKGSDQDIEEVADKLALPLCKLIKILVPNFRQKVDEIIQCSKRKTNGESDLIVSNKQFGADIVDNKTGAHYETKTSVVLKKKDHKCNFNWDIPSLTYEDPQRIALLKSVREKTERGNAQFIIVDHHNIELKKYTFTSDFLVEYFKRVRLTKKSTNHNFGCDMCYECKSWHRLDNIEKANNTFIKKPDIVDWDSLFERQSSQCKKGKE